MKRLNIIKIHNVESESHSEAQLLQRTLYTKISKKTEAKLQLTFNCYCPVSFSYESASLRSLIIETGVVKL